MRGYNKCILMGNLTRDVELKFLPSQTAVAEFGLAMNRRWKDRDSGGDREEVTFVDCSAFGKTAELINEHFAKGKPIMVEGRLKLDQWDDKQTGAKRSKLSVVVESFTFVGGAPGGDQQGDGGNGNQQGGGQQNNRSNGSNAGSGRPQQQQSRGGQQNRPQQQRSGQQHPSGGGRREADIPF